VRVILVEISVIIPTYNRHDVLPRALDGYLKQTLEKKRFELIIVDDGSKVPVTIDKKYSSLSIKLLRQENKGANAARNLGLKNSSAKYVLFTGDDIIPEENFLKEHLSRQAEEVNIAVLGLTRWSPEMSLDDFRRWVEKRLFNYELIGDHQNCRPAFFWTSNISLERKWFKEDSFDEDFIYLALDDAEMGLRLAQKGLRLVYHPKARAYHYHLINYATFIKRQFFFGVSAVMLLRKYKAKGSYRFRRFLRKWPLVIYPALGVFCLVAFGAKLGKIKPAFWQLSFYFFFFAGFLLATRNYDKDSLQKAFARISGHYLWKERE